MEIAELKVDCGCDDVQHIRSLRKLKSQLLVLSSVISSKTFQAHTARQHLADLEQCYTALELSLAGREQRIAAKERLAKEQRSVQESQGEVAKGQTRSWEDDLNEAEIAHKDCEETLESLHQSISSLLSLKSKLASDLLLLDETIKTLKVSLHSALSKECTLKSEVSDLSDRLFASKSKLEDDKRRLEDFTKLKERLIDQKKEKDNSETALKAQIDEENTIISTKEEELSIKLLSFKAKNDEMEKELEEIMRTKQESEQEVRENLEIVDSLCEKLDGETKELGAAKRRGRDLEGEIEGAREEVETIRKETDDLEQTLTELDAENRAAELTLEKYRSELQYRYQEFEDKEETLIKAEDHLAATEAQITRRRDALSSTASQISRETESLHLSLESSSQHLSSLSAQEFLLRGQLQSFQSQDLMGTNKLQFDSVSQLKGEMVGITESTLKRKHVEQMRVLEEEMEKLRSREEELEAMEGRTRGKRLG